MESNVLVMSMVEGSDLKLERNNRLLNQNISNQEEKLKNRLASRSKSKHKIKDIRWKPWLFHFYCMGYQTVNNLVTTNSSYKLLHS